MCTDLGFLHNATYSLLTHFAHFNASLLSCGRYSCSMCCIRVVDVNVGLYWRILVDWLIDKLRHSVSKSSSSDNNWSSNEKSTNYYTRIYGYKFSHVCLSVFRLYCSFEGIDLETSVLVHKYYVDYFHTQSSGSYAKVIESLSRSRLT